MSHSYTFIELFVSPLFLVWFLFVCFLLLTLFYSIINSLQAYETECLQPFRATIYFNIGNRYSKDAKYVWDLSLLLDHYQVYSGLF